MEWWLTLILVVCGLFICIGIPMIVEIRAEDEKYKKSKIEMEKYYEIRDMETNGFCSGCSYGVDNCYIEGRAYCKTLKEVNKDE